MLRLAERVGARAVATNPVRHLVPEDAFLADALECMREIVSLADNHVARRNAEGYLKSSPQMRSLFRERPDLCDATLGVHERGMTDDARLRDRLHLELSMIRRMGYAAYFLTVADIVADIKAMGIHCACRGSAAGSLVCYLTGISDVDALRHDLVFERFINPMRDELPDIDIDVESARREDVYDLILSRYGDERAACVAMVDTYRARASLREVGKALGLPEPEVGTIAKAFPHIGARHLQKAI